MSVIRAIPLLTLVLPCIVHAEKASVELANGDTLSGELLEQNEEFLVLENPVIGRLSLPAQQVVQLNVTDQDTDIAGTTETPPKDIDATEIRLPEDEDFGLFGTGWLIYWKRRLDLGIAGSEGNSDNFQANLAFSADYESPETRITHKLNYFRAESDSQLSDHSFFASVNRDWLLPVSPWFRFAAGRIDIDQFKDWNYRFNINGGVGYEFIDTPDWRVLGRAGLGFQRTFGGDDSEAVPEGMLGVETRWRVSDHQSVAFENTLYPNLKRPSEVRNLTSLDWILDLDSYMGVALKLGLSNEYDNASEDEEENDFRYTASLAWTL